MRLTLLLFLLALAAPTSAQTCTTEWLSPTDGDWSTGTNWTAGVPDSSDTACVTLPGDYTVTANAVSLVRISGLVVGGASGTQTLITNADFGVFSDAFVGPNGRFETTRRFDAFPTRLNVNGTLLVEGTLVHRSGELMRASGGTLDVAPGGRLLLPQAQTNVGNVGSLLRIRGLFEGNCGGGPQCLIDSPLEVEGATVRMLSGTAEFRAGGTIDGVDFEVSAGAGLTFTGGGVRRFVLEGTIAGDPEGFVSWFSVEVAAGPEGATLALGGTGFLMTNSTGLGTILTSAGGTFLNTGLVVVPNAFSGLSASVLHNEGVMRIADVGFFEVFNGALLQNAPGGLLELIGNVAIRGNGRIENAGLIVRSGGGFTNFPQNLLRSLPGSEIRLAGGGIGLPEPAAQTLPAGATLTGSGTLGISRDYRIEGTLSPGTDTEPFATLNLANRYYPSLTAGNARYIVDVGADGQSDLLDIVNEAGPLNRGRLAGVLIVRVAPGYTPEVGDEFMIVRGPLAGSVDGAFSQIVVDGAPEGIAFITEFVEAAVMLRAVEVAPDGPITVSTTAPIGGGVRPVFLTGPGAVGVSAAHLECTECLDPEGFGVISAEVVGEGTLKEARFDLTSPRAFGFYDLVIQRAGLPDEVVSLTVRPYLSYLSFDIAREGGIVVRPFGYNRSAYRVSNLSNAGDDGFLIAAIQRESEALVALGLFSANVLGGPGLLYESDEAADPEAAPLVFGQVPPGRPLTLEVGQRIDPSDVLFPEQVPTGPDDPRIPFGDYQIMSGLTVHHASFDRMRAVVEAALRNAENAPLAGYLAAVDAADPDAVDVATGTVIDQGRAYVSTFGALLGRLLAELDFVVGAPAGLEQEAAAAFGAAMDAEAAGLLLSVYRAHEVDIPSAPAAVRDLLAAEFEALGGYSETARRSGGDSGAQTCPAPPPPPPSPPPTGLGPLLSDPVFQAGLNQAAVKLQAQQIEQTLSGALQELQGLSELCKVVIDDIPGFTSGGTTCTPPPPPPGGPPGGGGFSCGPPQGPVDPNDKTADADLRCEIGTVLVDDEEVTRCVRYFVPLADATEPILYTVDFENLPAATANAEFVTITDVLDPDLDPASLEVYATSSDSTFSYEVAGQEVTFRFVGIDLPPNVDAPEGEGYVTFGVRPRPALPAGTDIRNAASIVFDFNPPIETPEVVHELREVADLAALVTAPSEVEVGVAVAFFASVANLTGDDASETTLTITPPAAPVVSVSTSVGECTGSAPIVCDLGSLPPGDFATVEVVVQPATQGDLTLSAAAATSAFDAFEPNNSDAASVTIVGVGAADDASALPRAVTLETPYPNPSRGDATFRWGMPEAGHVDIRAYDLLGREVARLADGQVADAGWHTMRWRASVASGVYIVRLQAESGPQTVSKTQRLVIVR